jgi:hypothetical protein
MPRVEFEPTIPAFERSKTVHALACAATVIDKLRIKLLNLDLCLCVCAWGGGDFSLNMCLVSETFCQLMQIIFMFSTAIECYYFGALKCIKLMTITNFFIKNRHNTTINEICL